MKVRKLNLFKSGHEEVAVMRRAFRLVFHSSVCSHQMDLNRIIFEFGRRLGLGSPDKTSAATDSTLILSSRKTQTGQPYQTSESNCFPRTIHQTLKTTRSVSPKPISECARRHLSTSSQKGLINLRVQNQKVKR